MSEQRQQFVDKHNARRAPTHLGAGDFTLRRARKDDCRLLWEWANDPEARAVSFSQEAITWETHVQWFDKSLNSPTCLLYIATNGDGTPIGQIRFDLSDSEATVSVSLAKELRGRGRGTALIISGSRQCFADSPAKIIRAYIKGQNDASIRAFERAGFVEAAPAEIHDQPARQFVLSREALQ